MAQTPARGTLKSSFRIGLGTGIGVAVALLFFLITGALTYSNVQRLRADTAKVVHTHEVITELGDLLSAVQDAETGQRGFLLTGKDRYLEPYRDALARSGVNLDTLDDLVADNPAQQANVRRLKPRIDAKLAELKQTIDLRQTQGMAAALAVVDSDRGKIEMDAIRADLASIRAEERRLRLERLAQMDAGYRAAVITGILTALLGIVLTLAVGILTHRDTVARQRQAWLQAGHVGLAQAILGDKSVSGLAASILDFLTSYFGAQAS